MYRKCCVVVNLSLYLKINFILRFFFGSSYGKRLWKNLTIDGDIIKICITLIERLYCAFKVKVKVALWGFSTLRPFGLLYSYPQQVPAFISRGATHHTDARDLYQRRRALLPMNFANKSVIYENSLGSFTCRKAGTWDLLFYFPIEGILWIFRTPEKSNGFGRV